MKITGNATKEISLNPQQWAVELSKYWDGMYREQAVAEWLDEVLEVIHCEAQASFADREPRHNALRYKMKGMLIRWIRGPKATAFLQGRTAELLAMEDREAYKKQRGDWKPDLSELNVRQGTPSPGDAKEPGGSK